MEKCFAVFMYSITPTGWCCLPPLLDYLLFTRLSDLAHAAHNGSIETQRLVASIFLELVFNQEIRQQLTTRNIPGILFLLKMYLATSKVCGFKICTE